jgi:hypothetical protein
MSLVSLPMEQNLVWTFEHMLSIMNKWSFHLDDFLDIYKVWHLNQVLGSSSSGLGIWTFHQKSKEKIKELVLNL